MNTITSPTETSYEVVINSIKEDLPSLPKILEELIKRLSDVDSSLESIRELIEIDQAIASRVVKVSNKFEFLEPDEPAITTIHDALHKIGLENAKRISLNVSVLNLMQNVDFPSTFRFSSLWQHSLGVAVASAVLSDFTGYENPDQAYTSGLVHDLGKLIKIQFNQEAFCREIHAAQKNRTSLSEFESEANLIKHDKLGHLVMEFWQMPVELSMVAKWHHEQEREKRSGIDSPELHHLIDLVCLANLLVHKLEIGNSGHGVKKDPSPQMLESLSLCEEKLDEIGSKVLDIYEESSSFLCTL